MVEQFMAGRSGPFAGTFDTDRISTGEPGLPRQFRWGSRTVGVRPGAEELAGTGPCHHGSGDRYVRKHWYEVLTDSGETMTIYFERQPRVQSNKSRWWLFTVNKPQESGGSG